MAIQYREWNNLNSERNYPLTDSATMIANNGVRLPSNILSDLNIVYPNTYINPHIAAVGITNNIASAVIAARIGGVTHPLAVATEVGAAPSVNYKLTPLVNGVAGWITFGLGIIDADNLSLGFSDIDACPILPRLARSYLISGVNSIKLAGSYHNYYGTVEFDGEPGSILVMRGIREINGIERECILIGRNPEDTRDYTRREGEISSILFMNGVSPDVDGNIDIIVEEPLVARNLVGDGGFTLDLAIGTSDIEDGLPDEDGNIPNSPEDECEE